jgi:hypothetical protein
MDKVTNSQYDPKSRWGEKLISGGFCIIPEKIIKQWGTTGLDATDLALIANLAAFWWSSGNLPHPATSLLAKNLGVSKRTIERRIANMVNLGLLARVSVSKGVSGRAPEVTAFDLSGLIKWFEAV